MSHILEYRSGIIHSKKEEEEIVHSFIDYICSKVSKLMGILIRARKILQICSHIPLYNSLLNLYFTHSINIWGNSFKTHLKRIEILQKKIIIIITFFPIGCLYTRLLFKNYELWHSKICILVINVYLQVHWQLVIPLLLSWLQTKSFRKYTLNSQAVYMAYIVTRKFVKLPYYLVATACGTISLIT